MAPRFLIVLSYSTLVGFFGNYYAAIVTLNLPKTDYSAKDKNTGSKISRK